jgi:Flp pilus assembly secretin CpaC
MRKELTILLYATAVAVSALAAPTARAEDVIQVLLDQAKVIQLPEKTSTVIIGNPIVADVTMLKRNNRLIITGKGFGETNLIALDASGESLGESVVRVTASSKDLVVQRGMDRESYTCAPRCQPTVALGDTSKYSADVAGQIQARNALSAGH